MNYGMGPLPDIATVDNTYIGWIVPVTETTVAMHYHIGGEGEGRFWYRITRDVIYLDDPIVTPTGVITYEDLLQSVVISELPPLPAN